MSIQKLTAVTTGSWPRPYWPRTGDYHDMQAHGVHAESFQVVLAVEHRPEGTWTLYYRRTA